MLVFHWFYIGLPRYDSKTLIIPEAQHEWQKTSIQSQKLQETRRKDMPTLPGESCMNTKCPTANMYIETQRRVTCHYHHTRRQHFQASSSHPLRQRTLHPPASSKRADVAHNERSNPHTEASGSSSDQTDGRQRRMRWASSWQHFPGRVRSCAGSSSTAPVGP